MSPRKKDDDVDEPEQDAKDDLIVEGPSGKKIDLGRLVMGVGYQYKGGGALSDEDKEFVAEELKRRTKKS